MLTEDQINTIFKRELVYHTSRSGGKGGQNVNKVETKVELDFDVQASEALTERQKHTILSRYPDFINSSVIQIIGNVHRSQLENKEEARKKLVTLLNKLLRPVKKRVKTKPGKAAKEKKLKLKKQKGEKKLLRKKVKEY